jgi:hypothetical protein
MMKQANGTKKEIKAAAQMGMMSTSGERVSKCAQEEGEKQSEEKDELLRRG